MVSLISASGLTLAAIATIYRSWRLRAPAFLYLGLVLFVASCVVWSLSQGWEFGLIYAFCLPGLAVWPFIGANQVYLPEPKHSPDPRQIDATLKHTATHIGHGLVVLVGLMIASLLMSMAISLRLPTAATGQLAIGIILLPVLWGMLVYHYLATTAKGKALGAYFLLSVISALILIFLPGLQ